MPSGPPRTVRFAKKLRRKMTPPEVHLWQHLRLRPYGLKFRRQHPIGRYVADFYCHPLKLAVEVDGETHAHGTQPERDMNRDRFFAETGVATVRISARDVLADPAAAIDAILSDENAPSAASRHLPHGGGYAAVKRG
ncbi:MAG: endonuclease domain-containing protein [Pacificimonas sp.]|jgi:very-short-patch-repair endonuclease|nr:endonuclease domain-containing protein [Pacificimonas sp.]